MLQNVAVATYIYIVLSVVMGMYGSSIRSDDNRMRMVGIYGKVGL